ncbi:hypothetical protein CRE_19004 [Caenorhabditis remanei]|uniref:Uncharacterized protein n=1 Tax=Caenorhabditis remanei TaxID=31234 RepID=E3LL21_CAERE|nr:hypothetical protein CRE_19004 [Caenorhabditis remanei]
MYWVVISVSVISTVLAFLSFYIYFKLLSDLFISKKLRKSSSLTLFYVRFFVDLFMSFGSKNQTFLTHLDNSFFSDIIMLFIAFIKFSRFHVFVDSHSFFIFHIVWPLVNLLSIRAFLVTIITLDRTFAVFFPVSYHNYRQKISNIPIIFLALSYSGIENLIFWVICSYKLNVPPGCITMDCLGNMCYLSYFLGYEMANRLALIDAFIIFSFDVTPAVILSKFDTVHFEDVGPIFAFTKMGGYALEGYLVIRALKLKNEPEVNNGKSLSLVQVKPSGAS